MSLDPTSAIRFDGSGSAELGTTVVPSVSDATIFGFFYPEADASATVVSLNDGSILGGWGNANLIAWISDGTGIGHWLMGNSTNGNWTQIGSNLRTKVWYAVALIVNGSNTTGWFTTVRRDSKPTIGTSSGNTAFTPSSLIVGCNPGTDNFTGRIYGVRCWYGGQKLSPQELLVEARSARAVRRAGLGFEMSSDGPTTGTYPDLSGRGATLTVVSSTHIALVTGPPLVRAQTQRVYSAPSATFVDDDAAPRWLLQALVPPPPVGPYANDDGLGAPILVDEEGIPNAGVPSPFLPDALGPIRTWHDEVALLGVDEEGIPNAGKPPPYKPDSIGAWQPWQDEIPELGVDDESPPNAGRPLPAVPDPLGPIRPWNDDGIGAPLLVDDEGRPIAGPLPPLPAPATLTVPLDVDEPGTLTSLGVDEEGAPLGRPLPPWPDALGPIRPWVDEVALLGLDDETARAAWAVPLPDAAPAYARGADELAALSVDDESPRARWTTWDTPAARYMLDVDEATPLALGDDDGQAPRSALEPPPRMPQTRDEDARTVFLTVDEDAVRWTWVTPLPPDWYIQTSLDDFWAQLGTRFVVWLGPKPVIVPVLEGAVVVPFLQGDVIAPYLGKPTI